ncbi:hypothetical protein [Ammoniphilus sp. YIM 78166]|uniref:hypothetical protein n=1 Tax=Ammoniphilus sp. YIM 78166 TaxID=1644106 RepID=UPI00106F1AFF|nr:hypothetical protein [Ammoniphilus sp. YIM 78166]
MFWIILGLVLAAVNSSRPYRNWVEARLKKKGFPHPEQKGAQRRKTLNILAAVYVLVGLALWVNQ